MLCGDDILLDVIRDQSEQIERQQTLIKDMTEEIALLRAGENADRCVICGAIIPEGRHVCLKCESQVMEHD